MTELRYDEQVVVITGAGSGLGRAYALFFATRGAKIVVNDLGGLVKGEGSNAKAADIVVDEIRSRGGIGIANYDSVEQGDCIVAQAINTWGRIDVLINNAGILRDVPLKNMNDQDWDLIMAVHLTGSYKTSRTCWAQMKRQRYGESSTPAAALVYMATLVKRTTAASG
jgi:multifunctional beta-oxidation protein